MANSLSDANPLKQYLLELIKRWGSKEGYAKKATLADALNWMNL